MENDEELAAKLSVINGESKSYSDATNYADCVRKVLSSALRENPIPGRFRTIRSITILQDVC